MPYDEQELDYADLILACEDFADEDFIKYHCFYEYEEGILAQLMAHGPVLLKGGRGTGKSALLREATRRLNSQPQSSALGIYLSLRHLPLLRTQGEQYDKEFLRILYDQVCESTKSFEIEVEPFSDVYSAHQSLNHLSDTLKKRIVLLFDDAAHIGREAGLEEFFDIFRTLSSNKISCKAAIYPGVTKFGTRFDVYNDARVIDISRRREQNDFKKFFVQVMKSRFSAQLKQCEFSSSLNHESVAEFLGMSVLGNVRSYIQGCAKLFEGSSRITFNTIGETLLNLSSDFFWPMLEEVKIKIGMYAPLMEGCIQLAEAIYTECGSRRSTSFIIHRQLVSKYSKPLEILEYVGFISKREASRGLKSGGRGTRYALNLCNTFEKTAGSRLTQELYNAWMDGKQDDTQFAFNSTAFDKVVLGEPDTSQDISILNLSISKLKKSKAFPYGLTDAKIERLTAQGWKTVGELAEKSEEELCRLEMVGPKTALRIKNTVDQAIWM
jgi:hypothetical protein